MVKAVLFDADGVLIDATEIHYQAMNKALELYGYTIPREQHLSIYNGLPTKKKLKILTERESLPEYLHRDIEYYKQTYTREMFEQLTPDPSKVDLLTALKRLGVRSSVCSNSLRVSINIMLTNTGLISLVDDYVGNDDVPTPKPDPGIYLEGARRLGINIKDCIIIEDSPVGIQAAEAAGPLKVIRVSGVEEVNLGLLKRII